MKDDYTLGPRKPATDTAEPNRSPYIDYSDPGNPMFRHTVGDETYWFTLRDIPENTRPWLAQIAANNLNDAYSRGRMSTRAEIQTAIRNALML